MRRFCGASRYRSGRGVVMPSPPARVWRRGSAAGRFALLGVVLAGASFGCAAKRGPLGDPVDARIRIEIQNRGFDDATVRAIFDGRRVRLGTVTGKRTANFMLPVDRSTLLALEIDLLAGPDCTTREMWVDPGDIIVFEILSVDIISGFRYCGR